MKRDRRASRANGARAQAAIASDSKTRRGTRGTFDLECRTGRRTAQLHRNLFEKARGRRASLSDGRSRHGHGHTLPRWWTVLAISLERGVGLASEESFSNAGERSRATHTFRHLGQQFRVKTRSVA